MKLSEIIPYICSTDTTNLLQNKFILFDTNAIIYLLENNCDSFLKSIQSKGGNSLYIHSVYAELLATDKALKRAERLDFINRNNFEYLPLNEKDIQFSTKLQTLLHKYQCHPSVTDLYLGAKLITHRENLLYVLTANIKDFPFPIFQRHGHVLVQNNTHSIALSFLRFAEEFRAEL